ncbi:2-hydroxyacid dehydrogenase [Peribacillus glennii]|uniref:D-glycerate dehydrogenase n=1 Tax=Peribacillus glennii TaxID=2303991 RepID=A0A372LCQ8_9BACI|nr:D-glycerate dehydrogenase [Peribacillus glennii]RFU63785.1 D-glycerate dehydrogenase [Peribacillus glennii]
MAKKYVFISRKLAPETVEKLREQFEVKMWDYEDQPVPREILIEEAKRADALLTMLTDKIDEELLSSAKNLRVVANMAVGFDNVDVNAASERGVAVCNTPDVLTDTTADLTFGLLIAAARRIVESAEAVKNGEWKSWSPFFLAGHDIHHKTIGIVGMGKIGEAVAKRAAGFDMEVLYHNRSRKTEAENGLGAIYCEFGELLQRSDFVVSLIPLSNETFRIFNADAFRRMKNSAIFVNASRGAVVDENALFDALVKKEIAGAGLDVFEKEPIDASHPLLTLKNVVALPHIGSASVETRLGMMNLCAKNITLILNGREPETLVNKLWLSQNS